MKANVYGVAVEGTVEEVLAFKAALEQQANEYIKPVNYTVTFQNTYPNNFDSAKFLKEISEGIKKIGTSY